VGLKSERNNLEVLKQPGNIKHVNFKNRLGLIGTHTPESTTRSRTLSAFNGTFQVKDSQNKKSTYCH
jgi:hypothetical protein